MPIVALCGEGGFDSETTRLLGEAFDAAWKKAQASGAFTDEASTKAARERLAKRIVELARRGERNHHLLVEGALGYARTPNVVSGPWITAKTG